MTSRRCIVLEEGVRELLELHHYTVRIIPVGYPQHSPPVHIVASRGSKETRYIRIKKVSRRPRTIQSIETTCRNDIMLYRKILSGSNGVPGCTANSGSIPCMTGITVLKCSPAVCGKFQNSRQIPVYFCRRREDRHDPAAFVSCGKEPLCTITGVTGLRTCRAAHVQRVLPATSPFT